MGAELLILFAFNIPIEKSMGRTEFDKAGMSLGRGYGQESQNMTERASHRYSRLDGPDRLLFTQFGTRMCTNWGRILLLPESGLGIWRTLSTEAGWRRMLKERSLVSGIAGWCGIYCWLVPGAMGIDRLLRCAGGFSLPCPVVGGCVGTVCNHMRYATMPWHT